MRTSQEILKEMEKVLEKSKELARELEAVEAAKKESPYWHIEDIEEEDAYLYVNDVIVRNDYYKKNIVDETRVDKANAFKNETYAEKIREQQDLIREMDRFSWENGAGEIDWKNYQQKKFYIECEMVDKQVMIGDVWYYKIPGVVYFASQEAAEEAIEIFEERIKALFR